MKNLRINNVKAIQEDFWGNGAVYHGYAGMPDDAGRVYTEEQCDIEFKRVTDMKLKIARTYYTWWAWDHKTNTWDWDNEVMTAFYKWLQRMKEGEVTIALNTGWWCPGDLSSNGFAGKSPFVVEGDFEQTVKNYGDWVSETYKQLVVKRGFTNVKIFVLFTEPQHYNENVDHFSFKRWLSCVKAAHNALVRDGYRDKIKLMGPNEGSTDTSIMVKWCAEYADEFLDIYSSHNYENSATISKKLVKTGETVLTISMAGGRICRTINLEPNTEYVAYIDLLLQKDSEESPKSVVHFGVYPDDGRNDIHNPNGFGPNVPLSDGSSISMKPSELTDEYKRYSISFNSGNNTSAVIGYFHDVKTASMSIVESIGLKKVGCNDNIVPNGCFENDYSGWRIFFGGCTKDPYLDWQKWSKTGLQYVPENKPYIFDEYNSAYIRDYSYDAHGAEICTAAISLMNAGVNSSLLWTLFDQQWPNNHTDSKNNFYDGDHRFGVAPILTRSLVPHKSYYAFSLLSKYVDGAGSKVYEGFGKDCLHTTMSVSKDGDVTIVVANCKDVSDDFTIEFDKPLEGFGFNRHAFSPENCKPNEKAEIIGIDKVFNNITNTLSDKISAYGVSVYTTHID